MPYMVKIEVSILNTTLEALQQVADMKNENGRVYNAIGAKRANGEDWPTSWTALDIAYLMISDLYAIEKKIETEKHRAACAGSGFPGGAVA